MLCIVTTEIDYLKASQDTPGDLMATPKKATKQQVLWCWFNKLWGVSAKCFLTFWLYKYLYILIIIRDNITRLNCLWFFPSDFWWEGALKYSPNIMMNVILMVRIFACGMIPRELILVSLPLINLLSLNGAVFFPIWNPSTKIKINALSRFKDEFSNILVFVVLKEFLKF